MAVAKRPATPFADFLCEDEREYTVHCPPFLFSPNDKSWTGGWGIGWLKLECLWPAVSIALCVSDLGTVKSQETVGNSWTVFKVILGHKYHHNR